MERELLEAFVETREKEAFYAGARAFISPDLIVRPHQEAALPAAWEAWRKEKREKEKEKEKERELLSLEDLEK